MSYELTSILNRCDYDDAKFLISIIDSYLNFTDDKGLKKELNYWSGQGQIPIHLNHKIETEIRYLGSNDFAYMTHKMRGYEPAGIGIDEIIDDLCKLMNIQISTASTLDARLEIFAGKVIDKQFASLSVERKREILEKMDFNKHHRDEIINKVINGKELLLPVLLPALGTTIGPEVIQGLIIALIAPFIGIEAAKVLIAQIVTKLPILGAWLGPLVFGAGTAWAVIDIIGPASRKTIPLILYLGVLCFRDGQTHEFMDNLVN